MVCEASLTYTTNVVGRVVPLKGITSFVLFIKMEADMVRVERRSGKERRSGVDRRQGYAQAYGGSKRASSWDRRSGKDRRKSPPVKE